MSSTHPTMPISDRLMIKGRSSCKQCRHTARLLGHFWLLYVSILGEGLRDTLDPKFNKRGRA